MLNLALRANREILTIDCSEPTVFRIQWRGFSGEVRVAIDAERTAGISREPCTNDIDGMSWIVSAGDILEIEALAPGKFECQVIEAEGGQFVVKLRGPEDFLFLFDFESEAA